MEHRALEAQDHRVVSCKGPVASGFCPLVESGACATVAAADGVVFRLDLDDPYHRTMLSCYLDSLGGSIPLHVVVKPGQEQRLGGLLDGVSWSVGDLGSALPGFSAQVAMAATVRIASADWDD